MPNREDFGRDIALTESLQSLATAYEEIAVMRIRKIREAVLATRSFREGLVNVFADVRASRQLQVRRLLDLRRRQRGTSGILNLKIASTKKKKKKKEEETEVTPHSSKKVKVLMSANERLSGSITMEVFRRFVRDIDKEPSSLVLIGDVGKDLLSSTRPNLKIDYYQSLPDEHVAVRELQPLVRHLLGYDSVTIYYGRFVNLVDQIAAAAQLFDEAAVVESPGQRTPHREQKYFLFEPSLSEVVSFFDTHIFTMLFKQTLDESLLALLGSRITAMEEAGHNIDRRLKKLRMAELHFKRDQRNRKQRQALAGMNLWS